MFHYKVKTMTVSALLIILGLLFVQSSFSASLPAPRTSDVGLNTAEIIENHGYPSETHHVVTEDGYILTLHRIPHGINDDGSAKRPAAFFMHGLSGSSSHAVDIGPERGIGFVLADAGYDVWLGNARGNEYCRNHTTFDVVKDAEQFFNFSWHEIGYYDVAAYIDYILSVNGDDSLYYIGSSQGTSVFFVLTSTRPEYNAKIRLASLISPAALMSHRSDTDFLKVICKYIDRIEALLKKYKIFEVPFTDVIRKEAPNLCTDPNFKIICEAYYAIKMGNDEDYEYNKDLIPVLVSHRPSNTAIKQYIHFGQQINNGGFSWFDYGPENNLEIYGTEKPPAYNFSKISAPVAFYYAKNDGLIPYEDDLELISMIPNVVKNYLVPSDKYTHMNFELAKDVVELVYNVLIDVMKKF